MGMDVIGVAPKSIKGKIFMNNCHWWYPLWRYCENVAPQLCSKVVSARSNDGDGLTVDDAKSLANVLRAEIDAGRTAQYEIEYRQWREQTDEECDCCRQDICKVPEKSCAQCNGTGRYHPIVCFTPDNVQGFAEFLEACGGFKIW